MQGNASAQGNAPATGEATRHVGHPCTNETIGPLSRYSDASR